MSNRFTDWYRQLIRNSKYRWLIIVGTLVYLLSPIDILPDVIPIIGQVDDVLILTLLITEVSQMLAERIKAVKGRNDSTVENEKVVADSETPVEVNAVRVE